MAFIIISTCRYEEGFSVGPLPNKTNFQKDLLKFDARVTDQKEHYA